MTNRNTLNRDRNTLKRLVESYGKKDVLNYINHLNEDEATEDMPIFLHYNVNLSDELEGLGYDDNIGVLEDQLAAYNDELSNFGLTSSFAETQDKGDEAQTLVVEIKSAEDFENLIKFFAEIDNYSIEDEVKFIKLALEQYNADAKSFISRQTDPRDVDELLSWI